MKMQLLYGTGNPGKLSVMKRRLSGLDIEVSGAEEVGKCPLTVEETGRTLMENARWKAKAYYEAYGIPVFSCDTAIYFQKEGFPEELQPGLHTRRAGGKRLSDREMIAYYRGLVKEYGALPAQYKNAVCCYLDGSHVYECEGPSLWGKPFLLTDHLHKMYQPGFPLDGLSAEAESGISYYDLPEHARDEIAVGEGIRDFFRDILQDMKRIECGRGGLDGQNNKMGVGGVTQKATSGEVFR